MADKKGRLEDRPKRIKVEILPYDDGDINDHLKCLEKNGFIKRYQAEGGHYIAILNWSKHQNPHIKEAPSTIPAPENPGQVPENPEGASLIPDSLNLIPDSLEPPISPKPKKTFSVKNYKFPVWVNKTLFLEWAEMRKKIKKPIASDGTITRALNVLEKLIGDGHDQDAVIALAIDQNWRSFYPPNSNGRKSTGCWRTDNNIKAAEDFINDDTIG